MSSSFTPGLSEFRSRMTTDDILGKVLDCKTFELTYDEACESKTPEDAYYSFREATISGSSDTKRFLAMMYYYGKGVIQNKKTSRKWMLKAAKQGSAEAQVFIGIAYLNDEYDPFEAYYWFKKAEKQKSHWATFFLGALYQFGLGVAKSEHYVKLYYDRSSTCGNEFVTNWSNKPI